MDGLHHRTCSLCEAMCGLVIEHRDGEVVSIKPNRDDVLSRGHICPKAVALKDLHEDPDRVRKPLRRTADGWEEIGWQDAFDLVEQRIAAILRRSRTCWSRHREARRFPLVRLPASNTCAGRQ